MRKCRNLKSSLVKAIICSIVLGFLVAVILSHMALAIYIATTCEDPTPILEYLDRDPDNSIIRSGY